MGKVRQTVRKDGLRIITKRLPYTNRVMFSVTALVGGATDNVSSLGIAHYLEHMVFQGTKTRDKDEISRELDLYCISHNADTSHLRTRYYGEAAKMNYKKMAEVILDLYCNPVFPEDRVENERGVINNEILMRRNKENIAVFENLLKVLYGEDSLVGRGIIGTKETVATINRNLLFEMHRQYYRPARSVVIVTGDVSHREVVALVNKNFPLTKDCAEPYVIEVTNDHNYIMPKKTISENRPGSECAYIFLGVKLPNGTIKDRVISSIIVKYFQNLIYDELRQKRGLVYSAYAGVDGETPLYNIFYLFAQTQAENLTEVKKIMHDIILGETKFEASFEDAKNRVLAESSVAIESANDWNRFILRQIISGCSDISSLDIYLQEIANATNSLSLEELELAFYYRIGQEQAVAYSVVSKE